MTILPAVRNPYSFSKVIYLDIGFIYKSCSDSECILKCLPKFSEVLRNFLIRMFGFLLRD